MCVLCVYMHGSAVCWVSVSEHFTSTYTQQITPPTITVPLSKQEILRIKGTMITKSNRLNVRSLAT